MTDKISREVAEQVAVGVVKKKKNSENKSCHCRSE
jgi:hypothetical protein